MRHDLEIPERYGIRQSVGDSVGPGGIIRALRNIPVLLDIARDMDELCPDAWLLNLTNPMTDALSCGHARVVDHDRSGLCHEVTITQFTLSLLLDVPFFMDLSPTVAGVNHLPFITALDVDGRRRARACCATCSTTPTSAPASRWRWRSPRGSGHEKISEGAEWTKGDLLAAQPA